MPALLRRFSSEQGYRLFDDALPTSTFLRASLSPMTLVLVSLDSLLASTDSIQINFCLLSYLCLIVTTFVLCLGLN